MAVVLVLGSNRLKQIGVWAHGSAISMRQTGSGHGLEQRTTLLTNMVSLSGSRKAPLEERMIGIFARRP